MENKSSRNTPLRIYHGVPKGWSKPEIVSAYKLLGGVLPLEFSEGTEPGAPHWMPDRYNWLQYRNTLREICLGIIRGEFASIEIAIRYIEFDYFGSYSGFFKKRMARLLRSQKLSEDQCHRLRSHFENLIENKIYFHEFKEYRKLLEKINLKPNA